ncbi:unnamed protein product [Cyprideis torosa]|uniref:Transcription initiation factor IIF subunit alpha n=1 Tax=Cyprideis torosa TaxID=163714 RepID=A0A7R8WII9_9CRUS|nr:unnamed protein product [Cyprideis torosa]CAG0894547.1 unnamed protein product [Cyprideis torosa]
MSGTESGGATGAPTVTEYLVRIPTKADKRFNLMKFNIAGDSDFARWTQARMERENNQRDTSAGKNEAEEIPKFGAGSEYGREAKEEARLKRLGIRRKKYNPESQPWLLRVGGKGGKRFKGIREGGVTENASFYVFTQAADGAFEAHPVSEWYNFTPVQRFKALTAEEAEEEFGRRDRIMNFFSVMVKKKCKAEEGEEAADTSTKEEKGSKKKGASKKGAEDLQISEMDEWVSDDDADEDDDEEEEAAGKEGKKKKKKKEEDDDDGVPKKKKKKKKDEDDEKDSEEEENPLEESDDGDEEGREMDYDSASSASDAELLEAMEERGVDEDMASSSSSEEEGEGEKKEGEKKEGEGAEEETASGDKKKKKKKKVKTPPKKKGECREERDSQVDFSNEAGKKRKDG